MVKLNKIYTRTGDKGTTGLGTGERVPKHALRIAAYGTVDEANAAIGVARLHMEPAYAAVDAIDWPNGFCRRDIGWRAIARES